MGVLVPKSKADFNKDSRATPPELYAVLDSEFHFTLDPCPLDATATAGASLWGKDGLMMDWRGHRVFCNPPYSDITPWLEKQRETELAVYLLPVRSDLAWWHLWVMRAREVRFIHGRLRFGGASGGAPFPSVVVIFEPGNHYPVRFISMERPPLPPRTARSTSMNESIHND